MSCLALLRSRSARRALLAAASALAIAPLAGADNYIWQTPSDGTDGVWSTAPADEYWFSSGIKPWSDNNTAIFSSAEGGNVQVSGVVTPSAVQVTGVGDWTFSTGENIGLGIAGTGTFEKSGSGSLTVRNVNSFAGTVTVLEGTLALLNERALGANATIAVKADATLGIGGNWEGRGGNLTWETGASLQVGADSTQAAVFKVDRLGVSGKIAFDLSNANLAESANDRVEVSGPLDLAGAKLDLNFTGNPVNPAQERNYVLFTYGSLPMDSNLTSSLLSPSQLAERTSYRLTADPVEKVIRLTVQGTAETLTWRSTNGNTLWQTTPKDNSAPMTDNWVNRAGSADYFYTADAVIFDNTANPAGQDVTIQGRVNPVSWVVNAWPDEDSHPFNYTFNAASAGTGHGVSGETGLTKTGSGTMTILTWNDFTGKVSIQGGTVSVGDGIVANVALGGEGSISLRAGTSLIYKLAAGTYDFTRLLEGGGRFVKDGVTNVMTFGRNGAGIIYNQIDVDLDVLGGELEIIGDRTGTQLLAEDRDITIHSEGLLRTPAKSLGDNFTTKITVNGVTGSLTRGRWELSGNQFIQPGNLEVNSGRITSTAGINGVVLTLGNTGDLNVSGEASFELPVILTASTIFKATAPGTELTFVEQVEDGGSGYSFAVNGPAKVDFAKGAVFSGATVVETAGSSVNFAGSTPPSTTALQLADGAKASLSNGAFTLSSAQFESKAGHTNDDGVFTDITGSARVAGGHTLSVGGHDTVETLRLSGDLILGSDSKLHLTVESGVTNQNDTIYTQNLNVQGTHSNPVVLYFESDDGVFRNGTYSLINFTTTDSLDGLNFGVQGIPVLRDSVAPPTVVIDSGKVNLVIATGNTKLTWQGENSDEWNQSTTKNWMDEFIIGADRTAAFQNGDAVIFSGAAPLVRITADVRPGRITVEGATNHTFTSDGGVIIGENTSLLKRGQGTLSLAGGLHTFTGTVTVLGGTLELAGGDTADNTLIGNNGVASRLGAGSGAGSLVLDGGTLSFSGGNATPDGVVTTETNRSFTIGQKGATITSNITSGTPHTNYNRVLFTENVPVAYSGRGDRTFTLAGNSNGDPTTSTNYNEIGLQLADPEGGKLSVVKDGVGTWGLTNANNSYTGGLTIKAGTVAINSARALGALPTTFFARNLVFEGNAGGTLRSTGFALILEANRGILLNGQTTGTFRTDTSLTVNGVISGQGGILKTGTNQLVLAGVNTFNGGISINTGTVHVQNDQAIPYGDNRGGVTMTGATGGALALSSDAHLNWLQSSPENNTTSEVYAQGGGVKTLYVGEYATAATTSYAFTGNLNENGATLSLVKRGQSIFALAGGGNFAGPIRVEGGVLRLRSNTATGNATDISVHLGSSLDLNGNTLNKTVQLAGSGTSLPIPYDIVGRLQSLGAVTNLSGGAARVDSFDLTGEAASSIGTWGNFYLTTVSGKGDLTFKRVQGDTGMGTGSFYLERNGLLDVSLVLAPSDASTSGGSGRLIVATDVHITAPDGTVNPVGGLSITSGDTGEIGSLFLNAQGQNQSSQGIINSAVPVSISGGGSLLFEFDTRQVFSNFASTDADAYISHSTASPGTGTFIIDSVLTTGVYVGVIGGELYDLASPARNVNFTKRGSGTFTLTNVNNNYAGVTRIDGGVLNLLEVLTDGQFVPSGVLGVPPSNDPEYLVLNGGTLRNSAIRRSYTQRLFTLGPNGGTIESASSIPTAVLQFTNQQGAIAFDSTVNAGVTLTLSGSNAGTRGQPNLFVPILTNPPSGGTTSLVKAGVGTWVFGADSIANTYTGTTTVKDGLLVIGGTRSLPDGASVYLGDTQTSGALQLNGKSVRLSSLRASETGLDNRIVNGFFTEQTPYAVLTLNVATTSEYSGTLGDSNSLRVAYNTFDLIKEGAGVLTLSGAAYNTGDIVVRTGTLRLGGVVLGDGSKRLLAQTASPFIFLNPDITANAKFDVRELGDEGYSINSGFSLVAGNQDNVADLEGNFRLNGGTLWIGGTREIKYTTTGGGNVRSGTAIADNADTTLIINGTLYSQAGKTSVINYSFSSLAASGSDLLNVTRLELNGIVNITPYVDPKFPAGFRLEAGSYGIINYGSVYADGVRQLRFGWQDPRYNVTFRNAATEKVIYMDVARRLDTNALYWTGDPGTQWGDPSVSGTNFIQEGVGHTSFASGDRAYFTDSVTDPSKRIVNVSAAGVILGEAIFENSIGYDYVLTGGVIGGEAGVLSKTGSGVLTIRNANTYGGGTVLEAGRLIVANNSALGVGTIFLNGGTLSGEGAHSFVNALLVQGTATLDTSSGTLAFGGTVSGAGTLVKTGNGTLQLNGSGSEFTGTIQVNSNTSASSILALGADTDFSSGEFVLSNGAVITGSFANDAGESGDIALGSLSGDGILRSTTAGEKHFIIGARDNVATATALFTGRVEDGPAGTVALTKVGAGTLILAGDNTYSGDTIVNAGVLQIGNGAFTNTVHGNVFIAQEGTLRFNGALTGTLLFPQDISGTGVFEKAGGNTLTLPNDLYGFTGTFRISDGVLQVGAGNAGGALNAEAKIENNGVLLLNRSGDYTLANDVSGTGEIRKSGSGRIVYIGDNTSTGVTSIQNGVFAIGDGSDAKDQQFNSSQIRLDHTRLELNPGSGSTLYLSGGVFGPGSGDPSIAIVKLGDGTAILAGDSEPGGEVSLIRGTLQIGNGGTSGSLENAPIRVADDTTLRFKRAGTSFVKGRITSTGRIEVQGSGTVVLTANNDIQGHVYIEDSATLQLGDGALPTGAFNNSTLQAVNVHLTSPNAVLAFNRKGTDLTTGSTVTLDGPGSFVKLGSGAVTFNSIGNHEGGTIAAEGRLIIPTANIPQNSYLEARDNGILQLSNGAIPFTFEKSFRGTGIIELGSDGTVAGNARTIYNYVEPRDGVTADLRILQVGTNTNFNLGSDPNAIVRARNLLILSGGLLTGTGRVTGTLINSVGAEVRPGGDVGGNIYLNGDFINEGVLNIKLQYDYNTGKIITDTIHYAGSADFKSGATLFVNVDALNGRLPETGERLEIFVDDDPENNPLGASMQGSILQTNAALYGKAFAYNNGHGVSLLFAHSLRDLPGLSLHAGLNDFVGYLDGILNNSGDQQNLESLSALGALLGASNQGAAINNASPLALASLTALPITAAREAARTTHAHLEGLRYDRRYAAEALDIAPYFTATGTFARNADGRSDPTFDSRNYGGLVGVDHAFSKDFIAGANAGYNIGKADFHNGGGKLDADSILFSLYGTYMISSWWYVDAQVFGGYNSYKVTHNSIGGTASAKPSGYDGGANAYFGSVIPLSPFVHFTPYAGFEFVHAEVGSFTEKGKNVVTALRVNSFSQDSLRAVIGTGLNWIVPVSATARLRLGLSLAYSLEVLDSDVDISARFANDKGTGTFKTKAPATPEHGIQVGPVVELTFGGNKAFSLGYTLEHDFSAQTIHHLNASFRVRF